MLVAAVLAAIPWSCSRTARAQVTLADDIILAAQGKENAGRARDRGSPLGRTPGTSASPYRHSHGSDDILLGISPTRRMAPLPRPSATPARSRVLALPGREPLDRGHGLAPVVERLPTAMMAPGDQAGAIAGTRAIPGAGASPDADARGRPAARALESPNEARSDADTDDGDPNGLTLDAAIDRLVRYHREALARHRRDALRINTVPGLRLLP